MDRQSRQHVHGVIDVDGMSRSGVHQPSTEGLVMDTRPVSAAEAADEILRGYAEAGITMFLLQALPHCRPADYEPWLLERGLRPFDAQDRVVRGGDPLAVPAARSRNRGLVVERVSGDTVAQWTAFLQRVYRLDTGTWLESLAARPRWHQYVVREEAEARPPPPATTSPMRRCAPPSWRMAWSLGRAASSRTSRPRPAPWTRPRTTTSRDSASGDRTCGRTTHSYDLARAVAGYARLDLEVHGRSRRPPAPLRRDGRRDPGGEHAPSPRPADAGRDDPGRHLPQPGGLRSVRRRPVPRVARASRPARARRVRGLPGARGVRGRRSGPRGSAGDPNLTTDRGSGRRGLPRRRARALVRAARSSRAASVTMVVIAM